MLDRMSHVRLSHLRGCGDHTSRCGPLFLGLFCINELGRGSCKTRHILSIDGPGAGSKPIVLSSIKEGRKVRLLIKIIGSACDVVIDIIIQIIIDRMCNDYAAALES